MALASSSGSIPAISSTIPRVTTRADLGRPHARGQSRPLAVGGAERFAHDPEIHDALIKLAKHPTRAAAWRWSARSSIRRSSRSACCRCCDRSSRTNARPPEVADELGIFYLDLFLVGLLLTVLSFVLRHAFPSAVPTCRTRCTSAAAITVRPVNTTTRRLCS